MTCPKCGSTKVEHKDRDLKEMNHSVKHHAPHQVGHAIGGHPAGLIFVAGCWAASKLIHALADSWSCKQCGHRFS